MAKRINYLLLIGSAIVLAVVVSCNSSSAKDATPVMVSPQPSLTPPLTLTPTPSPMLAVSPTTSTMAMPSPSASPAVSEIPLPTLKYRNEIYFYTFLYPNGYSINKIDAETILVEKANVGGIAALVDKLPVNTSPMDYFNAISEGKKKQISDWTSSNLTEVVENGITIGYRYDYTNTVDGKKWIGKGIVVKKGGLGFYLVFTTLEPEWISNSGMASACIESLIIPPTSTGIYSNTKLGINVTLPEDWSVIDASPSTSPALVLISPYDQASLHGYFYTGTVAEGTTAEQYIKDSAAKIIIIKGVTVSNQRAFTFNSGVAGYEMAVSASMAGIQDKSRNIALVKGNQLYRFIFEGQPNDVDALSNSIDQLVKSLVVS